MTTDELRAIKESIKNIKLTPNQLINEASAISIVSAAVEQLCTAVDEGKVELQGILTRDLPEGHPNKDYK